MSRTSYDRLNEIDDLIQKHGKNGIRLLLLFKLLKIEVKKRIRRCYPTQIIDEESLNRLCIEKANQLIKIREDTPTEEDVKDLLSRIRPRVSTRYKPNSHSVHK
jgi:hypothetical protein